MSPSRPRGGYTLPEMPLLLRQVYPLRQEKLYCCCCGRGLPPPACCMRTLLLRVLLQQLRRVLHMCNAGVSIIHTMHVAAAAGGGHPPPEMLLLRRGGYTPPGHERPTATAAPHGYL